MSANKTEIENFDKYAYEWWNKRGPYKLLHNLTPIRSKYIQEQIDITNKKVLDIGCGGGLLSEALHEAGADVYGIDASEKTIEIAKNHAKEKNLNITYICNSFSDFVKENNQKFDHVVCFEMIEHVDNQDQLIYDIGSLLHKESKVFFSTINRNLVSFIFAKVLAEYVFNMVPKNTHTYEKFIKPSELNRILKKNALKTTDITGIKFNPITQGFSLSEFNKINYFLTASKV
tara:strand:- start:1349 stop:2041 length:693 start_codon:yes stop_codon:yes gene_type:complete